MNREEIALETEHLDLLDALAAAKEAHRSSPTDATAAALNAAKQTLFEFRQKWRGIREAFAVAPAEGDGVARPATIVRKVK